MRSSVSFVLDGRVVTENFSSAFVTPTTTLLNFLRTLPSHKGVKEGCAEGDCGACTVVLGELDSDGRIRYKAVDSCLVFLPMIHGKHLVTVENLKVADELHPVQQAMVETGGSQCGFCTPGIVMSLFALYKNHDRPQRVEIDEALTGNLCRCTGYKPIIEAAARSCVHKGFDSFSSGEPITAELLRSIPPDSAFIETQNQTYFQPRTLAESLDFRQHHPGAIVICGATDVALRVTKKNELLKEILDVSAVEELKYVTEDSDSVRIGANAVLSTIWPKVRTLYPALSETFSVFGSLQIRNLATLAGNIGSASPIGDTLSALIPYSASVILQSVSGKREIKLDEFVTGYRQTVLGTDELIVEIRLPKPKPGTLVRWYKVSKRKDLDISTVSGGFSIELDKSNHIRSATLVYGGMAERVKRSHSTEQFLQGRKWTRETVEEAVSLVERDFVPISDARGGAEFRMVAAQNLLLKFWSETRQDGNGNDA